MKNVKYQCVLSHIRKQEKKIFRGVVAPNVCDDIETVCRAVSKKCGLEPELVKFVGEGIFRYCRDAISKGHRVDFGAWMACMPTIRGSFDTIDSPYDPQAQEICAKVFFKQAFDGVFDGVTIENTIEGCRPKIQRVLDTELKKDGYIKCGANVMVYISGLDLKIDPEMEDEKCVIVNHETEETYEGVIQSSTQTTLNVLFPSIANTGTCEIEVMTRGGKGDNYALKRTGRKVVSVSGC